MPCDRQSHFWIRSKIFSQELTFLISLRKNNIPFSLKYAVYASIISLDRGKLYDKVVKGSEISEVLHDCPDVQRYLAAFYNCHYGNFFQCLAEVEQVAKNDRNYSETCRIEKKK